MQRIMIFGLPGSGKSTFAFKLHQKTKLPLYHLDTYFYLDNWIERPKEEFLSLQRKLVSKNQWIIDGNCTKSLEMRWEKADTVIYFHFNRFICIYRIIKRVFLPSNLDDTPKGCHKSARWKLFINTFFFHEKRARSKIDYLQKKYPQAPLITIKHQTQLEQLLNS